MQETRLKEKVICKSRGHDESAGLLNIAVPGKKESEKPDAERQTNLETGTESANAHDIFGALNY